VIRIGGVAKSEHERDEEDEREAVAVRERGEAVVEPGHQRTRTWMLVSADAATGVEVIATPAAVDAARVGLLPALTVALPLCGAIE
jgi:hypothetical protein